MLLSKKCGLNTEPPSPRSKEDTLVIAFKEIPFIVSKKRSSDSSKTLKPKNWRLKMKELVTYIGFLMIPQSVYLESRSERNRQDHKRKHDSDDDEDDDDDEGPSAGSNQVQRVSVDEQKERSSARADLEDVGH
ncbi:hypothetical protein Tco_0214090 [Tanacetum coccineum]